MAVLSGVCAEVVGVPMASAFAPGALPARLAPWTVKALPTTPLTQATPPEGVRVWQLHTAEDEAGSSDVRQKLVWPALAALVLPIT